MAREKTGDDLSSVTNTFYLRPPPDDMGAIMPPMPLGARKLPEDSFTF